MFPRAYLVLVLATLAFSELVQDSPLSESPALQRPRRELEDDSKPLDRQRRDQNIQINSGHGATQSMGGRKRRSPQYQHTTPRIGVNTRSFNANVGPSGIDLQNKRSSERFRRQNVQINSGHGATQSMGGRKRRSPQYQHTTPHVGVNTHSFNANVGPSGIDLQNKRSSERFRRQNVQINSGNGATQSMGRRKRCSLHNQPTNPNIGVNTRSLNANVGPSGIDLQNKRSSERFRRQNVQVNTGDLARQVMAGRKRRDLQEDDLVREKRQNTQINTGNGATQIMQGRKRRDLDDLVREKRQNMQINTGNGATQVMGGRRRRETVKEDHEEGGLLREKRQNVQVNTGNLAKQVMGGRKRRDIGSPENKPLISLGVRGGFGGENGEDLARGKRQSNVQINSGHYATQIMGGRKRREVEEALEEEVLVRERRQANVQINSGHGATQIMGG